MCVRFVNGPAPTRFLVSEIIQKDPIKKINPPGFDSRVMLGCARQFLTLNASVHFVIKNSCQITFRLNEMVLLDPNITKPTKVFRFD